MYYLYLITLINHTILSLPNLSTVPNMPKGNSNSLADTLAGVPAEAPPPGVAPNFVEPVSNGASFIILGIFVSLMLLSVLIRVFVRIRFTKSWEWDDCKSRMICV